MKKKAQLARPSNLPGKCRECGYEEIYCRGLCQQCYMRAYRKIKAKDRGEIKRKIRGRPRRGAPSWVENWLRQQVRNFLHEHPRQFDRVMLTEDQVIKLCRLIYLARRHHNDKRGYQPNDNYARHNRHEEGDGFYLDKSISPELRGFK